MARKAPKKPRDKSIYDQCAAEWERRRREARERRSGDKPNDVADDRPWRTGFIPSGREPPSDFGGGNWLLDPANLPAKPKALMKTLQTLFTYTQDPVFQAARSAIVARDVLAPRAVGNGT